MKLRHTELSIPAGTIWLRARLAHAPDVRGLVIIAHPNNGEANGSVDARFAQALQSAGFATFQLDLITDQEAARDTDVRFNTPLLATRIEAAFDWLDHQPPLDGLARVLAASGTVSGAAMRAASRADERLQALLCRAGRLDLAGARPLGTVAMPVFVAVGEADPGRGMIERAFALIRAEKTWRDIPDAGAHFTEAGTIEQTAQLAAAWLDSVLPAPQTASAEPSVDAT